MMRYAAAFCSLLLLSLAACRKHGDDSFDYGQGIGRCRLSGVHFIYRSPSSSPTDTSSTLIKYNSDGRIGSMVIPNYQISTFSYAGNMIFIRKTDRLGDLFESDTVTMDGDRIMALSGKGINGPHFITFTYDADGVLKSSRDFLLNTTTNDYVRWEGGDRVVDSGIFNFGDSSVVRNAYYADKSEQFGSPIDRHFFLEYGVRIVQNKHLLKSSIIIGDDSVRYVYAFDSTNKIMADTQYSSKGLSPIVTTYLYDCK